MIEEIVLLWLFLWQPVIAIIIVFFVDFVLELTCIVAFGDRHLVSSCSRLQDFVVLTAPKSPVLITRLMDHIWFVDVDPTPEVYDLLIEVPAHFTLTLTQKRLVG